LHGNKIEGQLPRAFNNCVDLEVIDIGRNKIVDTFPSWLGGLLNLRVLVLRSNQFHGSIGYLEDEESMLDNLLLSCVNTKQREGGAKKAPCYDTVVAAGAGAELLTCSTVDTCSG